MKLKIIILSVLVSTLGAGCTEKTPGPKASSAPLIASRLITTSAETLHTIGKFDPAKAAMISKKGQSGALMFGPYVKLALGHYQATFLVTAESKVAGIEVGSVDVNGIVRGTPNSPRVAAPIKTLNGEQAIKLTFDATNQEAEYEFRVFVNGRGERTSVKSVRVEKL